MRVQIGFNLERLECAEAPTRSTEPSRLPPPEPLKFRAQQLQYPRVNNQIINATQGHSTLVLARRDCLREIEDIFAESHHSWTDLFLHCQEILVRHQMVSGVDNLARLEGPTSADSRLIAELGRLRNRSTFESSFSGSDT